MIEKIRFLHIPKTAGTTFDECLFRQYLGAYLLRRQFVFSGNIAADQQRLAGMSEAGLERIAICTGHAPLVTGCAHIDALPTVTLLRDPVARVKSLCRHISEGKSPQIYCPTKHGAFDLDALLGSGRIQLNNFQSRIVLGAGGYTLPAGSESALAARAMTLLASKFVCFGLTGELDRSLLLFQRMLGWRKWPLYRSRNTSNPQLPLQFEARHVARIEELNSLDLAFYELARETFFHRWQEHDTELEAALPRFRSALAKAQPGFAVIDLARHVGTWRRLISPGP